MSNLGKPKADTAARSAVAAHTPGPWKDGPVFQREGRALFITDASSSGGKWQRRLDDKNGVFAEADARLIAAAPDLLALAEEYLAFLWSEWHAHMSQADFDADMTVVAVRAAIKKARGQ